MKRASRILVVDDEPGMVRAVERVLGAAHRVIGSESSAQALALAHEFNPDLVILDIRMPELDGFELMVRLKANHPDVDVILMTGSVDDLDQKLIRAIRERAFYFIQKPFDREVLHALVDRCLELRWRREENGSSAKPARSNRVCCPLKLCRPTRWQSVAATCRVRSLAATCATMCRSALDGSRSSLPT